MSSATTMRPAAETVFADATRVECEWSMEYFPGLHRPADAAGFLAATLIRSLIDYGVFGVADGEDGKRRLVEEQREGKHSLDDSSHLYEWLCEATTLLDDPEALGQVGGDYSAMIVGVDIHLKEAGEGLPQRVRNRWFMLWMMLKNTLEGVVHDDDRRKRQSQG